MINGTVDNFYAQYSAIDSPSLKSLPSGYLIALTILAVLLIVSDALPDHVIGGSDLVRFGLCLAIGAVALAMALNARMTRQQLVKTGSRFLLLTVTLGMTLVAAEYAARWVLRDVTTTTDNAAFFTRRWLRTNPSRFNAQGYRGRAFTDAKPPGIFRVAVVGDSFTFGNGLRQDDRYTELLQARLPEHIEVLNFGEGGANTPTHLRRVRDLLSNINPDFILLQWYVNDMEDDDTTGRPDTEPLIPPFHGWLGARSALYTAANMKWSQVQVSLGWTRSYVDYLHDRLRDPHSQYVQTDARLLQELIDHCKKAGVPIGMVLFPDTAMPIDESYPFGYLHDRVLATCEANNITCVDLRPDFAAVKDHRSLWVNRFDHHPSARANAIATERILSTFSAKWAER